MLAPLDTQGCGSKNRTGGSLFETIKSSGLGAIPYGMYL